MFYLAPQFVSHNKTPPASTQKRFTIMATQYALTHPGLDRLGRSYDVLRDLSVALFSAITGWEGWSRIAAALDTWGHARAEALAMQDPRVRAEIQAAAQRMTSEDVR
jgi:hypothetical protein